MRWERQQTKDSETSSGVITALTGQEHWLLRTNKRSGSLLQYTFTVLVRSNNEIWLKS